MDYRPALREPSGAGEYTHQVARALIAAAAASENGHQLRLTLFSSSWKDRFIRPAELAGATIVDRRVPVKILNFAWHRLEWPAAETLGGGPFDVTHSSHPLLLPARDAAQLVTIHDLNFLGHPERTRAEIRRDYPALVRSHALRADRIVVPSAYTAGEVQRLLEVPPDRISVCAPGAPAWEPRSPRAPAGTYVLFLGTLEPRKNVGALLDAYELLSRRRHLPPLVLAGRTTDAAQGWLERLERPPLRGLARHVGYVDPSRRREIYAGALMLVQPSFEEGFGLPVLEAMTVGVPVVAANRGSLPEVLGGAGLLVEPDAPQGIADAIERVLDHPLAAEMAARGLERARSFTWTGAAERMLEAYRRAVQFRASRRKTVRV
jgi:glycosyltransferase involved in cell wall biosynthesis